MEVIIQLIIIFIIILSVLKRVKEASQKGQELDKGNIPGSILDMFDPDSEKGKAGQKPSATPSDQQEMPAGEYSGPVEITGEPSKEPLIPSEVPVIPPEVPYEPVEAQEMVKKDIFETQPDSLKPQEELIEEPVPEAPKPVLSRPAQTVLREADKGLDLGFTSPQVINGIIMREILGPPVSMRNDERVS